MKPPVTMFDTCAVSMAKGFFLLEALKDYTMAVVTDNQGVKLPHTLHQRPRGQLLLLSFTNHVKI